MLRPLALAFLLAAAPAGGAAQTPARARLSIWIQSPASRPDASWENRMSRTRAGIRYVFGRRFEEHDDESRGRSYFIFSIHLERPRALAEPAMQRLFSALHQDWGRSVRVVVDGYPVDMESRQSRARAAGAVAGDNPVFFNLFSAGVSRMIPAAAQKGSFYDGGGAAADPPPAAEVQVSGEAGDAAARPSPAPESAWKERRPAPPPAPAASAAAPLSSLHLDMAEARRLARDAAADATGFAGRCYRGVYEAIAKAYLLTWKQIGAIRWRFAYEFANSINANPELFKSRLRRLPGPEVQRAARNGHLPVGAIVVYGRAGDALCRRGGPEGGICGFSYDCGHIEIVTRDHVRGSYFRDPIRACSDGCRTIPEAGAGSLACIAANAPPGKVNVYVPVGRR
ncbi:MAG TPA: hypothetical protein VNK24_11105 [Elusimicrobiota bacterium]|nr:hypothetical protein [Elusimicrobiota bacterium]